MDGTTWQVFFISRGEALWAHEAHQSNRRSDKRLLVDKCADATHNKHEQGARDGWRVRCKPRGSDMARLTAVLSSVGCTSFRAA